MKYQDALVGERKAFLLTLVTALAIWCIYFWTLCPTVFSGDSGEFITLAYQGGVAHPPGYPLFILLGKIFTYLPWNSIAWRVNLLSATCSALAAFFLILSIWTWVRSLPAAILTGILYAFSPLIWRYSVVAEVFALNQLLISLLIFLAIRHWRAPSLSAALTCAFVAGLGMSNHHGFVFVGLPLYIWVFLCGRGHWWKATHVLSFIAVAFLGLLPYLIFFGAKGSESPLSWGQIENGRDFFKHLLRSEYGTFQLSERFESGHFFEAISAYGRQSFSEFLWIAPVLALAGLLFALRREKWRGPAAVLAISLSLSLGIFHYLSGFTKDEVLLETIRRFWQQPNLILILFAGLGIAVLLQQFEKRNLVWRSMAYSILFALGVSQFAIHFQSSNQRDNWLYHKFGTRLLAPLEPNSLLVAFGDLDVFVASYLQQCEGFRKDVILISQERLKTSWYSKLLKGFYLNVQFPPDAEPVDNRLASFLKLNADRFPVYISSRDLRNESSWQQIFQAWPVGFADRMLPIQESPKMTEYIPLSSNAWGDYSWMNGHFKSGWGGHIMHRYWWSEYRRASLLAQQPASRADHLALNSAFEISMKLKKAFPENSEIQNLFILIQKRLQDMR